MKAFLALIVFLLAAAAQTPNLIEQAESSFRSGDLDGAATLARTVAAREPSSSRAHMILGLIAAQRQQWVTAIRHFQTVVRLVPSNPHGYFYLGQSELYQKQWTVALQHFAKALERGYPDKQRLLIEMAFAENESGQPERALERLSQAPAPEDGLAAAQYHAVTAFAQSKLHRYLESIEAIHKARDLNPRDPQYWDFLITTLISSDQTPAALREAIRAQAAFPDHPDIQYLFALASYYVSESPLSPLALRNLREIEPDSPRVMLAEGLLHRKQGRSEAATRAFLQAAQRGVPDSHLLLGIIYRENGDRTAAERQFREAERLDPNNGQILLELGKLSLSRGDLDDALQRLDKAVAFMPSNSAAHYQLGLVYSRLGQKEKAEAHLSRSRELDKEQADLQRAERPRR